MHIRRLELLKSNSGLYCLELATREGPEVTMITDSNLGHIMAAISAGLKGLQAQISHVPPTRTEIATSPHKLDRWTIHALTVYPLKWQMIMESGPYQYTVNMDQTLEAFIAGVSGAMKFFGLKYGYITIEDDGTAHAVERG